MSLTSSEEEGEQDMDADSSRDIEEDLQRIQQNLESSMTRQKDKSVDTSQDKKRDRATDSSEGETKTKKTPKYRATPHQKGRLPSDSSDIQTDSSDDDAAQKRILNSTPNVAQPGTSRQQQTPLFPSTEHQHQPEEVLNKTLVPETPVRWNQIIQEDEQMSVHDTPRMETRSKASTRTEHD